MQVLLDRRAGDRRLVALASERSDGDVHPRRVPPRVLERRQRAVGGGRWTMIDQVHGTAVVDAGTGAPWPLAGCGDVLQVPASVPFGRVAIWAADCAPLVLFGAHGDVVGVHGGWRGLAAGVVDVAIDALGADIVGAVLGPVIHPCCYEFGEPELAAVAAGVGCGVDDVAGVTSTGRLALDVPGAVRIALDRVGIDLDGAGACTGCDDRWFSYRQRGDAGRHAVVAWSEPLARRHAGAADEVARW